MHIGLGGLADLARASGQLTYWEGKQKNSNNPSWNSVLSDGTSEIYDEKSNQISNYILLLI